MKFSKLLILSFIFAASLPVCDFLLRNFYPQALEGTSLFGYICSNLSKVPGWTLLAFVFGPHDVPENVFLFYIFSWIVLGAICSLILLTARILAKLFSKGVRQR